MPAGLRSVTIAVAAFVLAAAATVTTVVPAAAAGVGTLSLLGTTEGVSHGWDSVEHWNDTDTAWPATHYLSDG